MTPDDKYTFTINVVLQKDGANEPPMFESENVWNGLPYVAALQLEEALADLLRETVEWGKQYAATGSLVPPGQAKK